jgi:hypothetical protein
MTNKVDDEYSLAEVEAKIRDFNERNEIGDEVFSAEPIADKLARETRAYKRRGIPLEDLINDAAAARESVDKAVGLLKDALADLNLIQGIG